MKKSYLILAAVAGLLASCSSEVLVDDQPTRTTTPVAIGFSTFADKATRANVNDLEFYHQTFAVYGTKYNENTNPQVQRVFDKVTCTYATDPDITGYWQYAPARYWDKQSTYKFVAFAPAAAKFQYRHTLPDLIMGSNPVPKPLFIYGILAVN